MLAVQTVHQEVRAYKCVSLVINGATSDQIIKIEKFLTLFSLNASEEVSIVLYLPRTK